MLVAENKGITAIRSYPGYSYAAVGGKTRRYKVTFGGFPHFIFECFTTRNQDKNVLRDIQRTCIRG